METKQAAKQANEVSEVVSPKGEALLEASKPQWESLDHEGKLEALRVSLINIATQQVVLIMATLSLGSLFGLTWSDVNKAWMIPAKPKGGVDETPK